MLASDMALIFVLTLLSAFPAVLLATMLGVKWGVRRQLENLPSLLKEPSVQVAMRAVVRDVSRMGSGAVTKAIGAPIAAKLETVLNEALPAAHAEIQAELVKNINACVGGHVRNIQAKIAPEGGNLSDVSGLLTRFQSILGGHGPVGPNGPDPYA
jgi:hypothetical protein